MTTFSGPYVPVEHRAVRALWARIVAIHRARIQSGAGEFGMGYAMGFRDGLSEAYSAVTGVTRQKVGDEARSEAARAPTNSDLGSADVDMGSPSAEPSSNSEEEQP